jgi:hypothetical protein
MLARHMYCNDKSSYNTYIWRANMRDLHAHIPRTRKSVWFECGMKLPENTFLWCSALASVDPRGKLVRQLAPLGSN